MRGAFWKRWTQGLGGGLRRFPLGWMAALAAAGAAACLNHKHAWNLGAAGEGYALRVLLLWPLAVFGNVAVRLRAERDGRAPAWGLAALAGLLIGGWFLLPAQPQHAGQSFWFCFWPAAAACLAAALVLPARRAGEPALWDAGWSVIQAALMAALAALIAAGGVNAALVSVEKLFELRIRHRVYMDVVMAGFFLVGPVTAFAWLPHPYGAAQPLPAWVKGAARWLLMPLGLLYALILFAYIGRIALAARWPDGWVALPTLIFAAVGWVGYLIARTARERAAERWAAAYGRAFPIVLIPLAAVLLMAMRVRIAAYGFTEWRAIGALLGLWILGVALAYGARPRLSTWWLAATLGALAVAAVPGPAWISRRSQAARLERRLEALEAWRNTEGAEQVVSPADWNDLRSMVSYLLSHHGPGSLPNRVADRWTRWRADRNQPPLPGSGGRPAYGETDNVLAALGLAGEGAKGHRWVTLRGDGQPMPLGDWTEAVLLTTGSTNSLPFWINHELQLWAPPWQPVAAREREAFLDRLEALVADTADSEVRLPPEPMGYAFRHGGRDYRIQFLRLTRGQGWRGTNAPVYHPGGDSVLFLGPAPAP